MTYNNRIALMRRLLKSDSEEENEGDDHIDVNKNLQRLVSKLKPLKPWMLPKAQRI